MIECPVCHNVENQIVPFCSKCGTHLTEACPSCNRPFSAPTKKGNTLDELFSKTIKSFLILIIAWSGLSYAAENVDFKKYNPFYAVASVVSYTWDKLGNSISFSDPSTPTPNSVLSTRNSELIPAPIENPDNLVFVTEKSLEINGIKSLISLYFLQQTKTNKAQIALDMKAKLHAQDFSTNADIYIMYLFSSSIYLTDFDPNELDVHPLLLGKFVYIKNLTDTTIINEKEYEHLSDNLFVKWIR